MSIRKRKCSRIIGSVICVSINPGVTITSGDNIGAKGRIVDGQIKRDDRVTTSGIYKGVCCSIVRNRIGITVNPGIGITGVDNINTREVAWGRSEKVQFTAKNLRRNMASIPFS